MKKESIKISKSQEALYKLIADYYRQCKKDESRILELEDENARLNAQCRFLNEENLSLKSKINKVKKIPGVMFAYKMFKNLKSFKSRFTR